MKIGIVSDTHRNKEYLEKAADWLIKRNKIAMLFHLGDDYEDVMGLTDTYVEVAQVPGIYDERYKNGTLPAKVIETIQGLCILLVHSLEKDVTPEDTMRSNIILHGHTHRAELRLVDGLLFMNPGHLKGPLDKNETPSFGLLDIQDRSVSAKIISLDFKVVQTMELLRSENRLFKI
jgi:putative phosphoesterase